MNAVKKILEKEKVKIEKELFALIELHEKPYLSMGFIALQRSNLAFKRFINSNKQDKKAYWWADKWSELKKHYAKQAEKQDFIAYSEKRVKLESTLRDINNGLYLEI